MRRECYTGPRLPPSLKDSVSYHPNKLSLNLLSTVRQGTCEDHLKDLFIFVLLVSFKVRLVLSFDSSLVSSISVLSSEF